MNFNNVCLRIFYVLFILLVGALVVYLRGVEFITPLAIRFMETETTDAQVTHPVVLVISQKGSFEEVFRTSISYAGRDATLVTTTAPVALEDEELTLKRIKEKIAESRGKPAVPDPIVTFKVRYVKAFPSLVVRELPDASLLQIYRDTWNRGDWGLFIIMVGLVILMIVLLWKNVRKARRDAYWQRR